MSSFVQVAIGGAGPYGLSLAAHLTELAIPFRIFGQPMAAWQKGMPPGMKLKSEGLASTLFDPKQAFSLQRYCSRESLPYSDVGTPVPLEQFIAYGSDFQRRRVPQLEAAEVTSIHRNRDGFILHLDNGADAYARRVVVAAEDGSPTTSGKHL